MNIRSTLEDYREFLEHERLLAPQTVVAYLSDLRRLDVFVQGKDVEAIDLDELRGFMRDMSKAGAAVSTIRRRAHGFITYWQWLELQGTVTECIPRRLKLPRRPKPVPRWISEDDLRRFVDTPVQGKSYWIALRDSLAFKTLAYLGLRRGELLNLRVEDVRLHDDAIVIRNTKSKHDRVLSIPDNLFMDFQKLTYHRPGSAYVFEGGHGGRWPMTNFNRAFKQHLKRCGLPDTITPHVLRHSFGTHLVRQGVHVVMVKELMGHEHIQSTMTYTHADPETLKTAIKKHPLNK